ncbi:hypothetical protein NCC49_002973 [Naganishia albida]|nr:hypothetical protein NCC49_002973 [Naganishia albida]
MADLFVNNQTQDSFPHQNQSSSSDRPPSRDQRRQETTSSYTSMDNGTTPDFETLFNEQAESRGGSGHGNSTGVSGMWGLGGYDSQSPIGGNAHQIQLSAGQQVQHQPSQPQSIGANQKPSPFASSQVHGMPLSAPAQSRRFSGTGSLPRDRRRSSDNAEGTNVGTASLAGTAQSQPQQQQQKTFEQHSDASHLPVQQQQMYQLLQTAPAQEDPRFMSQERVMAYLSSQGLLSAHAGDGNVHEQSRHDQHRRHSHKGETPMVGPMSEAQQAAMFRAMMGMQQQQPDVRHNFPSYTAQDPGIWLADDGNPGQDRSTAPSQDPVMGLNDIEYDYNIGPSTAPPSLHNPHFVHTAQDISGFRFGQPGASETQTPQTAPIQGYTHDFSLEMQRQQMLGNQFSMYRSPHLGGTNISPGPSPLLAPQQLVAVGDLASDFDLQQIAHNQAVAMAQAQYHAQLQMQGSQGVSSGFQNNLAVEAMVRRHSHQRNASVPSSYAGSVHSGLEGLEDHLGQLTADGFEGSDFGGREAHGLDVEEFVDMDGGVESVPSVEASKGSSGDASGPPTNATSVKEEPIFGVWTTVQREEEAPAQEGNLWQAQIDSGVGLVEQQIIYAEPSSLPILTGDSMGQTDMPPPTADVAAPLRVIAALDTSGTSEFGRRMNSISSTRTASSSSSLSASNNLLVRTASPLNGNSSATGHALPNRSSTLDSNDGFAMPPFPTRSTSSPGSGGSEANSPAPFFNQPRRVTTLSGPQSKPHSPPQLFIPDTSSPSPSMKPAQLYPSRGGLKEGMPGHGRQGSSGYTHQTGQMTLGIPTGGNLGGHHGTGSFLSPIGPGGPSINIVPSTPTSGLREARGIWEKLAIQAHQNQHAQKHQSGLSDASGTIPAPQGPPRRASHAGIYVPVTVNEGTAGTGTSGNQAAAQPPALLPAQYGLPTHMLPPALRQRTRSEGAISAMISESGMQDLQQQWLEQQRSNESVDPRMVMGQSAMSSASSAVAIGQDLGDMQGIVYMSPDGTPTYVRRQGVVPGPEALGANFIVTNDGRRLSFDSRLNRAAALYGPGANGLAGSNQEDARSGAQVKPEEFDAFLTSMIVPGNEGAQLGVSPGMPYRRQVKSEDWGRPPHVVDPSSQQWLVPEPQSSSRRGSLASTASGSRSNSPSRARDSSPYARPSINENIPYPKHSPHVSPARSTYSLQDSGSEASGNSGRRGRGSKVANEGGRGGGNKIPRAKVTTPATEMASRGRRTSDGLFECPVPGCGSTFTRQFNLKGHIRSHNEERPYKCTFEGCDKSFARQHDCKRHMQLHIGIKPFVCENCNRTFARLDALSRHHKTDSGAECAMRHPLPTNPDGSLMSESKYRAEMERRKKAALSSQSPSLPTVTEGQKMQMKMEE